MGLGGKGVASKGVTSKSGLASVLVTASLVGLFAASACNLVTGADDIVLSDDDFGSDGAGASNPSGDGVGAGTGTSVTNTGSGAATGSTSASSNNSSSVASSTSASSSTASTTASSSSSGGPCQYPTGPYGVSVGEVVPPTLSWQGYKPGASSPSTISIKDFFDCDGTKGINALMVETSQYG